MKSAALLLSLALGLGQSDATEWLLVPQLVPGLELIYAGACTEESRQPGAPSRRAYALESRVLGLSGAGRSWDVAFMTTVRAREPGEGAGSAAPSVRLEVGKLNAQGRL